VGVVLAQICVGIEKMDQQMNDKTILLMDLKIFLPYTHHHQLDGIENHYLSADVKKTQK
jgi:hypothetical protein